MSRLQELDVLSNAQKLTQRVKQSEEMGNYVYNKTNKKIKSPETNLNEMEIISGHIDVG